MNLKKILRFLKKLLYRYAVAFKSYCICLENRHKISDRSDRRLAHLTSWLHDLINFK